VVDAFDNYLDYMLYGELPSSVKTYAINELGLAHVEAKLAQWNYTDPTSGELVWAWIPLSRNNISSARDCSLIGKMKDQQGYEWLPDVYTWLWSMSALSNYIADDGTLIYGDPIPPSGDTPLRPELSELKDPFVRLLLEDYMAAVGYEEPGIYRGVFDPALIKTDNEGNPVGALVWLGQSQILDRSGNSFPHGLNIWFPPSPLQWEELDMIRERTYLYSGCGVAITGETIILPAEYYCVDCPTAYDMIGLDFTSDTVTSWMEFFGVYYDSRWLIFGPGSDTGSRA